MRKLTGAIFTSLDGVIQSPGQPNEDTSGDFCLGGWVHPFWGESPFDRVITGDYDLLLGRRTYEIFAGFWPYNRDNPIGEKFERINKYVLTHSDEPLDWNNSHKLSGSTAEAVAELKRTPGRDLLIQGSSTLYPPLLSARLIDQLILITFPVIIGRGKRIFDGKEAPSALKLVEHSVSDKGVVYAAYEAPGDVPRGSFATKEPSQAERARQAKMKEGAW